MNDTKGPFNNDNNTKHEHKNLIQNDRNDYHKQRSQRSRSYILMGVALVVLLAGGGIIINHFANESSKTLAFQGEPVRLKLEQSYDHFEGWGTSLAWWANDLGGWKDQAKVSEVMDLVFDAQKGLGLNIVRYNIGGEENPDMKALRPGGDIPGFQPEPGVWDWEADAGQRAVLQGSLERGVNIAEAFSNSPPYWMTISGSVTGAVDGSNNLREDQYDAFADYLTEVVKHYRDEWGITFRTLDPLNEPSSDWWKKGNMQEGSHFTNDKQAEIIKKVAASLKSKGLDGTVISAADDNSIDETVHNFSLYDQDTLDVIAQINTHSYNGSKMEELRTLAERHGKKLWMSEYGTGGSEPHSHEDMTSVQELAERIMFDLKIMQPSAWVYWQAVEDEGANNNWGFIHASFNGEEQYEMTKQYYGMAQFTKFIRPGATIIPTDDGRTLAAYDAEQKRLVLVIRNELSAGTTAFELGAFDYSGTSTAQVYQTSPDRNMEQLEDVPVYANGLEVLTADNSITTVVLEGVTLQVN
ncbi:glycoside hydrolase family 30 protein [Paenibacillus pabuli]|uniref:glycoside hydrolase family 30 protein n=1 Tax=Paenibacillus pabuli TaxID=1472 RepID=UPI000AF85C18|nr:glycoside hydrolase [Paenibacillus pabuli]MEC0124556.1 glycoside hydrolase [Paenibacillus pabuli]